MDFTEGMDGFKKGEMWSHLSGCTTENGLAKVQIGDRTM